jgi:hypothetical protein
MSSAESAVLSDFHTFRVIFLLFGNVVITLLAFCTSQSDFYTHNFHLHFQLNLGIKKKPIFIAVTAYHRLFPLSITFTEKSTAPLVFLGAVDLLLFTLEN